MTTTAASLKIIGPFQAPQTGGKTAIKIALKTSRPLMNYGLNSTRAATRPQTQFWRVEFTSQSEPGHFRFVLCLKLPKPLPTT